MGFKECLLYALDADKGKKHKNERDLAAEAEAEAEGEDEYNSPGTGKTAGDERVQYQWKASRNIHLIRATWCI
jgi:hypothetical protein